MNKTAIPKQIVIIENLTVPALFFYLLPSLFRQKPSLNNPGYFIDSSFWGLFFSRALEKITGIHLQRLEFRLTECHDADGNLLRWMITYFDLPKVLDAIGVSREFQRVKEVAELDKNVVSYLTKNIAISSLEHFPLWRTLFLIRILDLKTVINSDKDDTKILFLERGLWMEQIEKYAKNFNIKIHPVRIFRMNLKRALRNFLGPTRSRYLRNLWRGLCSGLSFTGPGGLRQQPPMLGVEYYGHLNLDRPELYSDLFFIRPPLSGKDIQLIFDMPKDPLDEKKQSEMDKHGVTPIVLNAKSTRLSSFPVFNYWPRDIRFGNNIKSLACAEENWLQKEIVNYGHEFDYWTNFFQTYGIKVFTSWFKYDARHFILADVLRHLGGIMTIYQRAFEEFPAPETATKADIVFAFSKEEGDLSDDRFSQVNYRIAIGYLGDHRFPLLKVEALRVRSHLKNHGAKHILAYFDESSLGDPRWSIDHKSMQENYIFLLEKVLAEKWLGLILKPKTFISLRQRLGRVTELLDAAQKTNRCYIFQEGAMHVAYPPAVAALASDIAIHGHLFAATAGMESAFAGIPTLLLDREGWNVSKLYRLGHGRVVFTQWQDIWKACLDYWRSQGIPGFGDWSSVIDELDPFRDGQAAGRVAEYFQWLLDGFRRGMNREKILSEAAQRYGEKWGYDKIVETNTLKSRPHIKSPIPY